MGSPVAITIDAQKKLSPEAINVKLWNIYNYLYLSAILAPTFQTLACIVILVKTLQREQERSGSGAGTPGCSVKLPTSY